MTCDPRTWEIARDRASRGEGGTTSEQSTAPDALEANRAGRLSEEQRKDLQTDVERSAGGMVGRMLRRTTRLAKDVRAGRVESIEGAITKSMGVDWDYIVAGTQSTAPTSYRISVANRQDGDQQFRCSQGVYDAVPDAGMIRLFYLPTSRWVVSFELLPGPPVEDVSPAGVNRIIDAVGSAWKRHDKVGMAEARARLPALEREMSWYAPRKADAAPERAPTAALDGTQPGSAQPGSAQPGAVPLASAIVGTWESPFLTLMVRADATVTVRMADGTEQSGRWSVDGSGRLTADALGMSRVIDASITGDALTLGVDGQSIRLRRA